MERCRRALIGRGVGWMAISLEFYFFVISSSLLSAGVACRFQEAGGRRVRVCGVDGRRMGWLRSHDSVDALAR